MNKRFKRPVEARALALPPVGLLCLSLSLGLASAQEGPEEEAFEEIVVTGTRLTQHNLVSATPVNVLDTEAIDISGTANMAELIRTLPATGVSAFTMTNSAFSDTDSGLNTVELRNVGEDRTLVLVNGRRFVAGLPGTQAVDFNAIPAAFIERIDVMTGGASAVYGSDALAGVINIVTRTDFEGVQISAQGGISDDGDDESYTFSLTAGLPFAEGRGYGIFSYTYDKEGGVFARDREGLEVDGANLAFFTGDPKSDWQKSLLPFFSTYSELGRFNIPNGGRWVFDGSSTIPFNQDQHGFNRQPYRALSLPLERNLLAANMGFEVSDSVNLYMESTYASVESESLVEPSPLDSVDVYGEQLQQCDPVAQTCSFGIPGDNPFIPTDMLQLMRDANPGIADEDLVVGFSRRMTELGQRGASNLRQTFRLVVGIDGEFPNGFTYDLHANWGRTSQAQQGVGHTNVLNIRHALDVIEDPANPGSYLCADEIARAQGCIPVNLFGRGSITAGLDEITRHELLTYLRAPTQYQAKLEQRIISGYISGDLFAMPAGAARFVIGAEYRDEASEDTQDTLAQLGLLGEEPQKPLIGSINVSEAFIELELPLFADVKGAQSWDLMLAGRFSDYSTAGRTDAYSISTKYMPHDDWMIRAQYARAVRAPNIGELFTPVRLNQLFFNDPCEGVTIDPVSGSAAYFNLTRDTDNPDNVLNSGIDQTTVGSTTGTTCLQDPTVAARVSLTGGLALTEDELFGVSGFSGGAVAGGVTLEAETGDTLSAGFVWTPAFVEGLSLSIDWYNIEIVQGIDRIPRTIALDRCYGAQGFRPDSNFCVGIERWSSEPQVGALRYSNQFTQNLSMIETEGFDLQVNYDFDLPRTAGTIGLTMTYSKLLRYETTAFEGSIPSRFDGEIGLSKHEALLGILYSRPHVQVAWTTQWIGDAALANSGFWSEVDSVGDQFFHDLQGRFQIGDMTTLVVGVDNLTDEYLTIGFLGPETSPGWNTAPDIYDGIGRRYYLGLRLDF